MSYEHADAVKVSVCFLDDGGLSMGEEKFGREGRQPVEKFVLTFYGLHMLVMVLMSMNLGWSSWISLAMVLAFVIAISVLLAGYRDF